jgi:hypothetical protein
MGVGVELLFIKTAKLSPVVVKMKKIRRHLLLLGDFRKKHSVLSRLWLLPSLLLFLCDLTKLTVEQTTIFFWVTVPFQNV